MPDSSPQGAMWELDELSHAGQEHLDATYVAGYDQKSPTDWSDDVAELQTLGIGASTTVVDLGAGTGTFADAIAAAKPAAGSDSIRVAQRYSPERDDPRVVGLVA